jgi:hypothetical protein
LQYAHWEGHVLFVAEAYLRYIAKRKLRFSALMPSLQAVRLTSHIQEWQRQRDTVGLRMKIVTVVKEMENDQFKKLPSNAVETGGNLNYARFVDICQLMMIDAAKIIADTDYLDNEIVGVRNRIAHGDYLAISEERLSKAVHFVLQIMRAFRTDIEGCVLFSTYEKPA